MPSHTLSTRGALLFAGGGGHTSPHSSILIYTARSIHPPHVSPRLSLSLLSARVLVYEGERERGWGWKVAAAAMEVVRRPR